MKQKDKIRNRQSYKFWVSLIKFLNRNPSKASVLKRIHNLIDDYQGFGSRTNSIYSNESLNQAIKDRGV